MKPDETYLNRTPYFWAVIKYTSEQIGYSNRSRNGVIQMRSYSINEVNAKLDRFDKSDQFVKEIVGYLNYRSNLIQNTICHYLMNREEAKKIFDDLYTKYSPECHLPLNKQKGKMRHHAYFTCIINILTEVNLKGRKFDDNPMNLPTIIDNNGKLVFTFSRRIDGAYPSIENPKAVWEIKEYYGTTTFGSRVADGVYETQLDGYEILEAKASGAPMIKHYLLVDDRYTWWELGRSYLCRLIDTMHRSLVDEVIFGKEVLERWPKIVKSWL